MVDPIQPKITAIQPLQNRNDRISDNIRPSSGVSDDVSISEEAAELAAQDQAQSVRQFLESDESQTLVSADRLAAFAE